MKDKYTNRFGAVSIFNHWVIGLIFLAIFIFGLYLHYAELPRAEKGALMFWHKSAGATFIILALWRVGWRLYQGFPRETSLVPAWQSVAAKISHWLLLLAVLIMPISGMWMTLFAGYDVNVFNLFTIPGQEKNAVLQGIGSFLHHNAPKVIGALIIIHILAALKHHFHNKDKTLTRMMGKS